MEIRDKAALLTGASRGLGAALVLTGFLAMASIGEYGGSLLM